MKLALPVSEYAQVFRGFVRILRNDPTLSSVVKTWIDWSDKPTDAMGFELSHAPAVRLTPGMGPTKRLSPDSTVGPLIIRTEILLAGYDAVDMANFWKAMVSAFYAPTQGTWQANVLALQGYGAFPGTPEFDLPAFDPDPDSKMMHAIAQITITVKTQLGTRGASSTP